LGAHKKIIHLKSLEVSRGGDSTGIEEGSKKKQRGELLKYRMGRGR